MAEAAPLNAVFTAPQAWKFDEMILASHQADCLRHRKESRWGPNAHSEQTLHGRDSERCASWCRNTWIHE